MLKWKLSVLFVTDNEAPHLQAEKLCWVDPISKRHSSKLLIVLCVITAAFSWAFAKQRKDFIIILQSLPLSLGPTFGVFLPVFVVDFKAKKRETEWERERSKVRTERLNGNCSVSHVWFHWRISHGNESFILSQPVLSLYPAVWSSAHQLTSQCVTQKSWKMFYFLSVMSSSVDRVWYLERLCSVKGSQW